MTEAIETGITLILVAIWIWLCFLIGVTLITVCLVLWSIERIKKLFRKEKPRGRVI